MKRYISFLLVLLLSLILIPNVNAKECEDNKVCIISSSVEERTGGTQLNSDPTIEDLTLGFDVTLIKLNDYVKYNLVIQNNTDEDYYLNVENFNKSNYVTYGYSFSDNKNTIKANSTKTVYVTIKYNTEVPEEQLTNGYEEENRLILTSGNEVNPKTGQINLVIILSLAVVALIAAYVIFDKKTKQITLSILLLAILLPIGIKALTELTITVNTRVIIVNGNLMATRYPDKSHGEIMVGSSNKLRGEILNFGYENDFWEYGSQIKTITFQKKIVEPREYAFRYDVSEAKDESVLAYLVEDEDNYHFHLYIMANGIIYSNPDSSYMFSNMERLESITGWENFNTSRVTDMSFMFTNCRHLSEIDLSNFDTRNVTDMTAMFEEYGIGRISLDLSSFDTSKVTTMERLFYKSGINSLNISSFDTRNVTNMSLMFSNCELLTELDLSHFDTSNVTDMSYMFQLCRNMKNVILSSFNTSNVTNMQYMFFEFGCLVENPSLDLSNFDTSKVTSMNNMFSGMKTLKVLNINNFNTRTVEDMYGLFSYCRDLISIDLSHFDTSNVLDMEYMFIGCESLTSLSLDNFNTSKVTNMQYMFAQCSSLTSLDVSALDTSNVYNISGMFAYSSSLVSLDLSTFDTSNVGRYGFSDMFLDCSSLVSVDLSSFNTSQGRAFSSMFRGCSSLVTLDLSSFEIAADSATINMFKDCTSLKTIYVSQMTWNPTGYLNGANMFLNCTSLVGGNGTVYNSYDVNAQFARVDVPGTPGYFTLKQ